MEVENTRLTLDEPGLRTQVLPALGSNGLREQPIGETTQREKGEEGTSAQPSQLRTLRPLKDEFVGRSSANGRNRW